MVIKKETVSMKQGMMAAQTQNAEKLMEDLVKQINDNPKEYGNVKAAMIT